MRRRTSTARPAGRWRPGCCASGCSPLWPDLRGQSVLGVGFAAPYLRLWRPQAARCIAVTPAQMGATRWPLGEPCLSCTAEEDALPFPDMSFDRVLLVHGLEAAENARRLLRETWRVLKDDGRLLVVAPNRTGMWAYVEQTPFGHGQPYSFGQLGRLLAGVAVPRGAARHRAVAAAGRAAAGAAQRGSVRARRPAADAGNGGRDRQRGGEGRVCRDAAEAGAPAAVWCWRKPRSSGRDAPAVSWRCHHDWRWSPKMAI